ncbi:transposase [Olsenella sp. oral taxon 807]|uniref:transposase n=1 Tax=Olsenella sp. oral taxon 807 TaxID=712411 RepID=UPI0035294458
MARVPRRRGRVLCGETRREVGEILGMPAGAGMVEGSAYPDHTRICLRIVPKRGAGDVVGRSRGKSAVMPRERHHERGALTGRDRTTWARGHHAGTVGPGESVTGRHVRRQSDGSRTG